MCIRIAPDTADLSVRLSVCTQREYHHCEHASESSDHQIIPPALTQIIPDVHFTTECSHFNDGLSQKIIRLPFKFLLHARLDVIVFVPNAHFDSVRGVVTLAAHPKQHVTVWIYWLYRSHKKTHHLQVKALVPDGVEIAVDGLGSLLGFAHLYGDVRVTWTRLILRLQTLSTHNWQTDETSLEFKRWCHCSVCHWV